MDYKREKRRNLLAFLVLLSLIIPTLLLILKLVIIREYDSNTVLMLVQCLLGIIAFFIPNIIYHKLKLELPPLIYVSYIVFLWSSIFLGEVRNFYYRYENWDNILHFFSGMMLGSLGFSIITLLNKNLKTINLSPVFVMLFSISFAVSIGVVWEIYEFTFDGILNLNMQKFALEDGTLLIGRNALEDTMKDLIIDFCGAGLMSVLGYLTLKKNKKWFKENLIIKKNL